MNTESVLLAHLLFTEDFSRKVLPFVKSEYFEKKSNRIVFELLDTFVTKYNAFPTKEALLIDLSNKEGINDGLFNETKNLIADIKREDDNTNIDWLVSQCENWCQDRAINNAILASIEIIEKTKRDDVPTDKGAMIKLMEDAIAVSFDRSVGHDFLEDAKSRFDFYHTKEKRIRLSLAKFNEITMGGLPLKSFNVCVSVTGGGKTRWMCHEAANMLQDGHNVLYITLEMAEERIAERIEANLLDIPMKELRTIDYASYLTKLQRLKSKTAGRLIIKEYPTAGASAHNFRALIKELNLKKKFIPDIIFIDYINICLSSRIKLGQNVGSYGYVKAIAEELRGLGVEFKVPVVTGTQLNRQGFGNSDVELEHTSESMGLPHTADFMFALINNEELNAIDRIMVKQLKTRYSDPTINRSFMIGVDKPKMRLYDVDDDAPSDDKPIMDNSPWSGPDETGGGSSVLKFERKPTKYEDFK